MLKMMNEELSKQVFDLTILKLKTIQETFQEHKNNKLAAHILAFQAQRFCHVTLDKYLHQIYLAEDFTKDEITSQLETEQYNKVSDLCDEILKEVETYLEESKLVKDAELGLIPILSVLQNARTIKPNDKISENIQKALQQEVHMKEYIEIGHDTLEEIKKCIYHTLEIQCVLKMFTILSDLTDKSEDETN